VRCFYTGGEQVPLSLLRAYAEKGLALSQLFGQTETSTITWLPAEHAVRKMGSVGIPVFHGEVRVVDPDGRELPPGENGEIVVSGPILMSGYWGKPELTAETIRDGWLHTGDLGMRDEEGFYSIVDRVRNVFVSGGENVYPAEVERVLLENPKIAAAAVMGVPDEKWGESGKALVVCKEGETLTQGEIRSWCRARLAGYKVPKHVQWVDRIPENAAGKIMRCALDGSRLTVNTPLPGIR
jgi:fatty-acyl-CoA synthase